MLENPLNSKYLCETDTLSLAAADEPDADVDLDSDDVEEAKEVSESKTITDDFAEYENVKRDYPESYVLYQVGGFLRGVPERMRKKLHRCSIFALQIIWFVTICVCRCAASCSCVGAVSSDYTAARKKLLQYAAETATA